MSRLLLIIRAMKSGFLPLAAILLMPCIAVGQTPKPEVKSASVMGFRAGHTTTVILYGENLTPKEISVKPPLKVKLLDAKPTDEKLKSKGSRQVTIEVTVPTGCPHDTFDLTLIQPDGAKTTTPICVVDDVAVELPVKKPASTYAQAMAISGSSVAIQGELSGDTPDVFRVNMKAGETWEIYLLAGRANSLLDPVLRVRDQKHLSRALSVGDKKRDRHIRYHPPADGTYYIEITESEAKGGAGFDYRLTVYLTP